MYVIAIYDVESKKCGKMLKLCRQYLHWVQNSVFEGELTSVALKDLVHRANKIIDPERDSFIIFKNRSENWLSKEIHGLQKSDVDQFL